MTHLCYVPWSRLTRYVLGNFAWGKPGERWNVASPGDQNLISPHDENRLLVIKMAEPLFQYTGWMFSDDQTRRIKKTGKMVLYVIVMRTNLIVQAEILRMLREDQPWGNRL